MHFDCTWLKREHPWSIQLVITFVSLGFRIQNLSYFTITGKLKKEPNRVHQIVTHQRCIQSSRVQITAMLSEALYRRYEQHRRSWRCQTNDGKLQTGHGETNEDCGN